jgi:hypothetical protein
MKTVLHGPFKGLLYPYPHPYGNNMYNKIYGTYEKEIQDLIELAINNKYDNIINIGCGEGYYAVGLALKCPDSKIFAYEIAPEVKSMCEEMSLLNKVSNITIKDIFNILDINFKSETNNLVICDCEGCELSIFNDYNIMKMLNFDFIIETHDFSHPNATNILINKFKNMGKNFKIVEAIPDREKIKKYKVEELNGMTEKERYNIFSENRPDGMKWIYSLK